MGKIPVTVIIPCYCCASTVGRAVESVYKQTSRPSEVILVDDASPDETYQALQQIQGTYGSDWLRIIRLDNNSGPSLARNTGWNSARYPYIAFLDADDSWHVNKLEVQYRWMLSRPDVVMSGHECAVVEAEPCHDSNVSEVTAHNVGKYRQLFSNQFSTPSVMLKRDIPFRFPSSQRYAEDSMLWSEIILHGFHVYKLNSILAYLYKPRYGTAGLSSNMWQMELGELINYKNFYSGKLISISTMIVLSVYSLIKYLRRLILIRH